LIVEVNIGGIYFSELLKNKKKGIVIKEKSSAFLIELKESINIQIQNKSNESIDE